MLPQYLEDKIIKTDPCWVWVGAVNHHGYGIVGIPKTRKTQAAYKVVYEAIKGGVAKGLDLDHVCMNPPCVNPEHLEPVTHAENMRRWSESMSKCRKGHDYTLENTYMTAAGTRQCIICNQNRSRKAWAAKGGYQTKTHCPNGHEYTPESIYYRPSRPNTRECRTCRTIGSLKKYHADKRKNSKTP